MERDKLPGTLMLWPGVAEELARHRRPSSSAPACSRTSTSSLFAHVGDNLGVSWGDGGGNGLVSVEYTFKGESAHSAGAPWRGRSALDAVELMDVGWNFRREHLRLSAALALRHHQRRRPAERRARATPASGTTSARPTTPHIKELWDIGNKMAEGAALMTDTDVHVAHARHRPGRST